MVRRHAVALHGLRLAHVALQGITGQFTADDLLDAEGELVHKRNPEILIEELPAYSPELNPEEYCHGNVKKGLKNARPTCKSEMRSMLDRGFARLRHRPDLLLSFFHRAGLSVRQLRLT